ncbi:MAG TPA: cytochrome c [Blastocatellia bacterium]|nr:cytochrome c [Blastocatellia bacterium]
MKKFLSGVITAFALACIVAFTIMKLGLVPLNADAAPSSLEKSIFSMAVRSSVAHHATEQPKDGFPTNEDLLSGAEIYKGMCAECHGSLSGRPSTLGASFYPPAPQLPGRATAYTEPELFWIVKHGIRNTSMPSWRNMLSDEGIWQVVSFVKRINALPPEVGAELKGQN